MKIESDVHFWDVRLLSRVLYHSVILILIRSDLSVYVATKNVGNSIGQIVRQDNRYFNGTCRFL